MMHKTLGSSAGRPLFIDLNSYTDGDDAFRKELIDLIIDNLCELQQTLRVASQSTDVEIFRKVCHKVTPTIQMLQDPEFTNVVEQLKVMISDGASVRLLDKLCTDIMESLRNA